MFKIPLSDAKYPLFMKVKWELGSDGEIAGTREADGG